ncbi:MAG: FAD-binding oxidoreductase, partial [Deltaproteobacteria bacterium]|nr:FAD-binding oxidoreductase [Deltaproteobacteria bacterium]
ERLAQALARRGFTQGHFPSSMYCSTLGGWIAARSAGQFSTRYGKIEDQVLGGVAVLGDGTLVTQGPSPLRAPELDALIGAEGALGVWTQATLRIHPLPAAKAWRGFDMKMERAVAALEEVMASGLVPSVVRLYDPLDSLLHRRPPHSGGKGTTARLAAHWPRTARLLSTLAPNRCRLIVGVEGDGERVQCEMQHIIAAVQEHGGEDLGEAPGVAWYRRRYAISYEQSRAFRAGLAVDTMEVACAWERVMPVYASVRRAARAAGALVAAHISHIYVEGAAIYFTFALPIAWGTAAYDRVWQAALAVALSAGANVSHHHGTGRRKASALAQSLGGAMRTLGAIVQRFDPGGVLAGQSAPEPRKREPPRRQERPDDMTRATLASPALFAAAATARLAEIENGLASRGRSLRPAAQLFGAWQLGDAAQKHLLWRHNPQLGIIESMVAGVDAMVSGAPHFFVPAPRAASGPDMLPDLLRSAVERVWLRTSPWPALTLAWQGDLDWALRLAQELVRDA